VIELEHVSRVYVIGDIEVRALDDVSVRIEKGEMVAIMGPSGSGKSTLMNLLGCLDRPSSGRYILVEQDVSRMSDDQLAHVRNHEIGFVFQGFNLLKRSTAQDNVELPMIYAGSRDRRKRAMEALKTVGLGDRLHHRPNELSGGQQQRVAIARALVNDPSIILADEPTGNLDSRSGDEIMALFQHLNRDLGITVVVVTHDQRVAEHTQRIVRLADGCLVGDEAVAAPIVAGDLAHAAVAVATAKDNAA
jgi:putative ABC transport system ATP-binding protein